MSAQYKMTLPDALEERIEELPGTYQEITLRALHLLVYGSPVEQELRSEIERLHETIRSMGKAEQSPPPPPPTDKQLRW